MKVTLSFAPQLQASKAVEKDDRLDYVMRIIPAPDGTNSVTTEVFDTRTGHISELFVRYEYNPACRVELIYG